MLKTTQITAAPKHERERHRGRLHDLRDHLAPRFTNEVRSRVTKSFFIISVLDRHRPVEPEVLAHLPQRLLVGVAAGDPRGRVDAGRGEEDQEHEHADREQDEHHRDEPAEDEAQHQAPIRSFARGSSASRTPSPSTFSASTVSAIAIPGASATAGRV